MRKINVVTIHGIGVTESGYAEDLIEGITEEFNRLLQKILGDSVDFTEAIAFKEIVWDDILAENQEKLKNIFAKALSRRKLNIIKGIISLIAILGTIILFCFLKRPAVFWLLLVPVACLATYLIYRLRTGFAAEFVNDIIGYQGREIKDKIRVRILREAFEPTNKLAKRFHIHWTTINAALRELRELEGK